MFCGIQTQYNLSVETFCSKYFKTNTIIGDSELVTYKELGDLSNQTKATWDFHSVGIYVVVSVDIGITLMWDRKTSIILKLGPSYKV